MAIMGVGQLLGENDNIWRQSAYSIVLHDILTLRMTLATRHAEGVKCW